jgi:hypothetical protein
VPTPLDYQTPPSRRTLPASVIAVACIFIAFGLLSAINVVRELIDGRLFLDFNVLELFAGLWSSPAGARLP